MRTLSALVFLANFVAAATMLDAALGLAATLFAFISTAIIWYANQLGAIRTDYFVRRWLDGGDLPPESNAIVIDKESPPLLVMTLGWFFLLLSTVYTCYLVLNR